MPHKTLRIGASSGPGDARGMISALLLDDSDFDRERLCRIGRSSGLDIEISAVPTIAEMERRLDEQDFDLVLIDYRLSEGDGMDALDRVKTHHRNGSAATVMITGDSRTDLAVEAMQHGCDDYLDKSALTPDLFRSRMVAAMDRVVALGARQVQDALGPERLRHAFAQAFDPATVRRILAPALRPLIVDAVREAVARGAPGGAMLPDEGFDAFVEAFLQPDRFVFRD